MGPKSLGLGANYPFCPSTVNIQGAYTVLCNITISHDQKYDQQNRTNNKRVRPSTPIPYRRSNYFYPSIRTTGTANFTKILFAFRGAFNSPAVNDLE